ncbi:MAG: undecaprenyldiphospho-muramoylpentapeptide beta-N-acetylglucosaminyltransferase [Coriobacteriales bacterium]|nr:undecaprenyldiphospho-muramoylpentapeptide beta-N-acetylglucosaminyltransferase [Coriobacteriales bacterium]
MKVLMSGGGTAGHIYPALAVAQVLASARDEVLFVGTPNGLEARLVPEAGVPFVGIASQGFDRSRPLTLLTAAVVAIASTLRAIGILRKERPDVVLGFGGYVSIPVGLAAAMLRIPLALHEQNSVPGLANRVLSRWAGGVGVTYDESRPYLKHPDRVRLTGNPVRERVLSADRRAGREELGLPADAPVLLVFGGSRGARHINTAVVGLRHRLLEVPGLHIVHVAGRNEAQSVRKMLDAAGGGDGRWHVHEYLEHMGDALAAADLIVARAGATSIAEITCLGRPALLVPYPYATDDHQTTNAKALAEHGAAMLVTDSELDTPRFGDSLLALLGDEGQRANMAAASSALARPDAGERVADLARRVTTGAFGTTDQDGA